MVLKKSLQKNIVFLFGFGFFVVLFLLRLLFAPTFSSLFQSIARPFWNLRAATAHGLPFVEGYVTGQNTLVSENQLLQSDITILQTDNAELSAKLFAVSNPELTALVKEPRLITAKVLDAPPYIPFDYMYLDLGSRDGISIGDTVYSGDNILIGEINQVSSSGSTVMLYSSPSYVGPATVLRTGQVVSLQGQGNANFSISLPKDSDVVVGDLLVDNSADQSVIAQVYSVDTSADGSFKQILCRIPINIFNSQWVGIEPQ